MIGQRLRQLRRARGMSLDALAAEMGGIVTKQSLSKYENGTAHPSPVVLTRMAAALRVKSAYLWAAPTISVEFMAYRKRSGLGLAEMERVEGLVTYALEQRVRVQELTEQHDGSDLPVRQMPVSTLADAERAAEQLRSIWNLGTDAIASVVGTLEDHLVHVLQIDANEKFDGISAVARDDRGAIVSAAVVTRQHVPGDRQRLNLAHELGHLLLNPAEEVDEEKAAFRFGTSFLIPAETLRREVGTRRAFLEPEELVLLKKRFGMSIQALLYRLRELRIIGDSHYKNWCILINKHGWKRQEPLELPPEQPEWLRRNVLRAFAEEVLAAEEAEEMLGEPIASKHPLSLVERRSFLKLPPEERRRILAEQAQKMASYYRENLEWRELQAGDFVEY